MPVGEMEVRAKSLAIARALLRADYHLQRQAEKATASQPFKRAELSAIPTPSNEEYVRFTFAKQPFSPVEREKHILKGEKALALAIRDSKNHPVIDGLRRHVAEVVAKHEAEQAALEEAKVA